MTKDKRIIREFFSDFAKTSYFCGIRVGSEKGLRQINTNLAVVVRSIHSGVSEIKRTEFQVVIERKIKRDGPEKILPVATEDFTTVCGASGLPGGLGYAASNSANAGIAHQNLSTA